MDNLSFHFCLSRRMDFHGCVFHVLVFAKAQSTRIFGRGKRKWIQLYEFPDQWVAVWCAAHAHGRIDSYQVENGTIRIDDYNQTLDIYVQSEDQKIPQNFFCSRMALRLEFHAPRVLFQMKCFQSIGLEIWSDRLFTKFITHSTPTPLFLWWFVKVPM